MPMVGFPSTGFVDIDFHKACLRIQFLHLIPDPVEYPDAYILRALQLNAHQLSNILRPVTPGIGLIIDSAIFDPAPTLDAMPYCNNNDANINKPEIYYGCMYLKAAVLHDQFLQKGEEKTLDAAIKEYWKVGVNTWCHEHFSYHLVDANLFSLDPFSFLTPEFTTRSASSSMPRPLRLLPPSVITISLPCTVVLGLYCSVLSGLAPRPRPFSAAGRGRQGSGIMRAGSRPGASLHIA